MPSLLMDKKGQGREEVRIPAFGIFTVTYGRRKAVKVKFGCTGCEIFAQHNLRRGRSGGKLFCMRQSIPFIRKFAMWLDDSLSEPPPKSVRAFVFGVNRRELTFAVELNGTAEFHQVGDGWIWSEIWSPGVAKLTVPAEVCRDQISECTRRVREAIQHYLDYGAYASRLSEVEGIAVEAFGVGYSLIWTPDQSMQQRLFG